MADEKRLTDVHQPLSQLLAGKEVFSVLAYNSESMAVHFRDGSLLTVWYDQAKQHLTLSASIMQQHRFAEPWHDGGQVASKPDATDSPGHESTGMLPS